MISDQTISKTYNELKSKYGGVREDCFGLLYMEQEHAVPREKALNQVAFGGNDYGIDGFHFDEQRKNLYIFQFKYSKDYGLFKGSLQRLIDSGVERIFHSPNKDEHKNQILTQLRACIQDNRAIIDQVCFRFVFTGKPEDAEHSEALTKLREDLEYKSGLLDTFFQRDVQMVVDFRSSTGHIGITRTPRANNTFPVKLVDVVTCPGPDGQTMHLGFIRLADLHGIHHALGTDFFERNIRYGLGDSESVNRAIVKALRQIVIDRTDDPGVFTFNHNGVTLNAAKFESGDGEWRLTSPRMLNGAQTVTTTSAFLDFFKDDPRLVSGRERFDSIHVLCKIITDADKDFITRVTINNNRQTPVEPWNLHANDLIQLELQDKLRDDLGIYYERQENAFSQLSIEDLEAYGISEENKAVKILKLTQTYLLTDGTISRISEMKRVFEEDKTYEQVFRKTRLNADSRYVLLCYKAQFRLRKLTQEIEQKGQNKYWFMSRARYMLWALLCQGLLNHHSLNKLADEFGTTMSIPAGYTELLTQIATTKVRPMLAALMQDPDYADKVAEENLGFLRTDRAFDKCMAIANERWGWMHKKLV